MKNLLMVSPPLTAAEDPKKRRESWFRRAAAGQADPGGVFIDAAHGVGGPKMEALAKVGGEVKAPLMLLFVSHSIDYFCAHDNAQSFGMVLVWNRF